MLKKSKKNTVSTSKKTGVRTSVKGKKIRVRREDVLMGLDGMVYLEGKLGGNIAQSVKRNKRPALNLFRKIAPDLKSKDITIDKTGRVKINNPKITEVARAIAEEKNISDLGKVIAKKQNPSFKGNSHDNEVDFLCSGDLPGGDGDLDIFCGRWDEFSDDPCNFNFFCGWS